MREWITDIVLIGPVRAGKSTIGRLLAERLNLPQVSLDTTRWRYYPQIGYDEAFAREIRAKGGLLALSLYWSLFSAYGVEKTLADHRHCVFDFGAGIYESHESLARVAAALAPYPNVILLLPSPDLTESLAILRQRDAHPPADLNFDVNGRFLRHPSYTHLAKITIYTQGKTPAESCDEILQCVVR